MKEPSQNPARWAEAINSNADTYFGESRDLLAVIISPVCEKSRSD